MQARAFAQPRQAFAQRARSARPAVSRLVGDRQLIAAPVSVVRGMVRASDALRTEA